MPRLSPVELAIRSVAILLACLIAGTAIAPRAWADEEHQGLQAGWAIDDQGNVNFTSSFSLQNVYMHEAEASWIRLNFRLGACYQDWVSKGCNGRTALETYDEVIDIALNNGFQILGLVGHEAWPGKQEDWNANNAEHTGGDGDNPYLQHLADDAVTVLATHYKGRIHAWEIWNEPNTWTDRDDLGRPFGGSFIYPSGFAWALTHAYEAIKLAQPDATVVSGGLFGHDLGESAILFAREYCPTGVPSGADYLCATYEMGLAHAGWLPGEYPFDHVGQHIYIDGGGPTSEEKLRAYLDEVRDAYLLYEGPETSKITDITEFGWSTAGMSQQTQADNMVIAYDTFRTTGYVGRAYWFHAQDVPEANLFYGLADASGKKKKAFDVYQDVAAYDSPEPDQGPRPAASVRPPAQPSVEAPRTGRPDPSTAPASKPALPGAAAASTGSADKPKTSPAAADPPGAAPAVAAARPSIVADLP